MKSLIALFLLGSLNALAAGPGVVVVGKNQDLAVRLSVRKEANPHMIYQAKVTYYKDIASEIIHNDFASVDPTTAPPSPQHAELTVGDLTRGGESKSVVFDGADISELAHEHSGIGILVSGSEQVCDSCRYSGTASFKEVIFYPVVEQGRGVVTWEIYGDPNKDVSIDVSLHTRK